MEKILANLFYLFFVCQIFSPYVNGMTIYIEVLIALFNPYFYLWLKRQKIPKEFFLFTLILSLVLCVSGVKHAANFLVIIILVSHLIYTFTENLFYLYRYLLISIGIGIIQIVLYFIDFHYAILLGPNNISHLVWGSYATPTNTNFFPILYFVRVSGLSREGGFFASLILISILLTSELNFNSLKKLKIIKFALCIGFAISLSKMSLILIPCWIIMKNRKIIDIIPTPISVISFIVFFLVFWSYNSNVLYNIEYATFLHRFGGYLAFKDLTIKQLLFGVENIHQINSIGIIKILDIYDNVAGFPGFIFNNGFFIFIAMVTGLALCGVKSSGFLILLLSTINVELLTNQNFVVLSYFFLFILNDKFRFNLECRKLESQNFIKIKNF